MIRPENQPMALAELRKIPLQRLGTAEDIAKLAYFLITDADYMTGTMLSIDGGRLLYNSNDDQI